MTNAKLRRARHSEVGACYAITIVCHRRRPLLRDPACAGAVEHELQHLRSADQLRPLAWVLMPDHLHALFQLRDGELPRQLQAFKSRSAIAVNKVRGISGAAWQAGYYDHRLRSERQLRVQARYLLENPLRGGLATRIEDYPYWYCAWVSATGDLLI